MYIGHVFHPYLNISIYRINLFMKIAQTNMLVTMKFEMINLHYSSNVSINFYHTEIIIGFLSVELSVMFSILNF